MKQLHIYTLSLLTALLVIGCTTQKSKSDLSPLAKLYHNTTARYNGYFNANELYIASKDQLNTQYQENYNKILPIFPYESSSNPKSVAEDMDKAIEKVSVVVNLHRESDWTDDCYVLMAKAQYLKQDFESAEETLEYMVEEYSPNNLKKQAAKASKKRKANNKRKAQAEREKSKKERAKAQQKKRKESKKARKKNQKNRKKSQSQKRKDYNRKVKGKKDGKGYNNKKEETPAVKTPTKTDKKAQKEKLAAKKKAEEEKAEEDGYFMKHRPAFQEGQLWLYRTYIMRDKYELANRVYNSMQNKGSIFDDVEAELAIARANFFTQQKQYAQAVEPLNQAIELSKDRQTKARLAYIVAQIQQRNGNGAEAYAGFERVLKYGPNYEMEFRARLSMAQNAWLNGKATAEQAMKTLEKMLKDIKNEEYQDQVYFAMADVALKNGNRAQGIEYLEKSLQVSTKNPEQKAESYLQLAQLYYENENYVSAKTYYDSTMQVLPKTDERYEQIDLYANSLTDIAKNIEIITTQDSLLAISAMPIEKKRELALKIKKEQDDAKRKALIAAANNAGASKGGSSLSRGGNALRAGSRPSTSNTASNFFAYNDKSLRRGKNDFLREWGGRELEDNWRRSQKRTELGDNLEEVVEVEEAVDSDEMPDADMVKYLGNYPQTPDQKTAANAEIEQALFELGTLFRDRIANNEKSVETLERLLNRYPETENELVAWYYAYIAYSDLGNTAQAANYKKKIVEKYPDTTYGRALLNPNFSEEILAERNKLDNYYNNTYQQFDQGKYNEARERIGKVADEFGATNPLQAKFALLNAMISGNLEGKDAYIKSLKDVIAKYPDTPETVRAKEMLRLLGSGSAVAANGDSKISVGDTAAGEFDPANSKFKQEDNKLHYMILVFNDPDISLAETKASISDYNSKYHKLDKLRISNIYLGSDVKTPIIVVRRFKTRKNAMKYYDGVQGAEDFIKSGAPFEMYPVTQNNYREILKSKSLDGYQAFFEAVYL
ncbi:MAG: tetratricopeptide repeat protein [Saprospiraceae bacterium]